MRKHTHIYTRRGNSSTRRFSHTEDMHAPLMDAHGYIGMHMFIKWCACMRTGTHSQTHKLMCSSFKWGIGSHGNQIRSCWSHSTCHKMGKKATYTCSIYVLCASHTHLDTSRGAYVCAWHTHMHALASLIYGPWQEQGGPQQNKRKKGAKTGNEMKECARGWVGMGKRGIV